MIVISSLYVKWRLYRLNLLRRSLLHGIHDINHIKFHKSIDKSTWKIWLDLMICHFRYDANLLDYISFGFYSLPHYTRNTFVTTYRGLLYSLAVNHQAKAQIFHDKPKFNEVFSRFIYREWLDTRSSSSEQIEVFISRKGRVIAKPFNGTEGNGIFIIDNNTPQDKTKFFDLLNKGQHFVLEEIVKNHPAINKLNPHALNTLRIVTILDKNNKVHILCTVLRIGVSGSIIDNLSQGGIVCPIDVSSGTICKNGIDLWGKEYKLHPESFISLLGYQLPHWNEVLDVINQAATTVQDVKYVGWDIAITDKDTVEIIEANPNPGVQLLQSDGVGRWQRFQDINN